jgi:hypothetical protein
LDFLGISAMAINVPTSIGTLLCNPPPPGLIFLTSVGLPFAIAVPSECSLIGIALCAQAGSLDPTGLIALTNALDLVIGAF